MSALLAQRRDRLLHCKPRWSNKFVSQEHLQQSIEQAIGAGVPDPDDFDTDSSDTDDPDDADTEGAIISDIMADASLNDMDDEGDVSLSEEAASRVRLIWEMPVCGQVLSYLPQCRRRHHPSARLRFLKTECFSLTWKVLWQGQVAM